MSREFLNDVSTVVSFFVSEKCFCLRDSQGLSNLTAVQDDWCLRGNKVDRLRKVRVRRRAKRPALKTMKQLSKFPLDKLLEIMLNLKIKEKIQ